MNKITLVVRKNTDDKNFTAETEGFLISKSRIYELTNEIRKLCQQQGGLDYTISIILPLEEKMEICCVNGNTSVKKTSRLSEREVEELFWRLS